MLFKMALKNIKKSIRDYAIYFFTLIIGVSVFYVFNAIEDQTVFLAISADRREQAVLLGTVLSSLSVFVAVVLGLLIVFASRFLMKRRNKEFATYMLLGMSKGSIAALMFIETIIIGFISLVIGLVIGIGLSQLMSALVINLFATNMSYFKFVISSGAIIKTIINFTIIYIIVIIFDTIMVGKNKLINLIQSSKKSEKLKLKNPVLCSIIFVVSAVVLGIAYHIVLSEKMGMAGMDFKKFILAIALGAVSTFFIFWSVSGLLLRLVMCLKKTYFKKLNTFTLRQLSSAVNTMVLSMTIICLLLFFTISGLSAAFSLRNTMNENLKKFAPNDVFCEVISNYGMVLSMDGSENGIRGFTNPDADPETADLGVEVNEAVFIGKTPYEIWSEAGNSSDEGLNLIAERVKISNNWNYFDEFNIDYDKYFKDYMILNIYYTPGLTFEKSLGSVFEASGGVSYFGSESSGVHEEVIKLSDYNRLAELRGTKKIHLAEDEYAIVVDIEEVASKRNEALRNGQEIEVYGKTLMPAGKKCISGSYWIASAAENEGFFVVPDSVIEAAGDKAMLRQRVLTGDFNEIEGMSKEDIYRELSKRVFDIDYEIESRDFKLLTDGMVMSSKEEVYNSSIGFGAMATFLSLYLGIVFLITSAVILALKALSDSADSYERYEMLRRLGADEKDINGSLFRQQGIFFLLPMLLALFHSIFGIKFINKTLIIFGKYHILGSIIFTSLIIGIIYGGYFVITYIYSRQIIRGRR
ncbi:putative ABC transport system permease protein [Eubacterium ruminantium]|nr:putative ABC transport system permease protein [Eubacterium ruminantium]